MSYLCIPNSSRRLKTFMCEAPSLWPRLTKPIVSVSNNRERLAEQDQLVLLEPVVLPETLVCLV